MPGLVIDVLLASATLCVAAFFWFRLKAHLQFLQQEEYDSGRFLSWVVSARAFDVTSSAISVIGIPAIMLGELARKHLVFSGLSTFELIMGEGPVIMLLVTIILASLAGVGRSRRVLDAAKKPLVMTARARRIAGTAWILGMLPASLGAAAYWQAGFPDPAYSAIGIPILVFQLPPLFLVLANGLLTPFEKLTQRKYWRQAKEKLDRLDPFIIAITGSYGKTSTKHILAHILSSVDPTLATPGSVNTEMGIARIVREQLKPEQKYFIVEMGAYGPGSIARLCRLAPPKLGLITAVGHAHYERFKSLETVADAKFELAAAVYATDPEHGRTVVNVDAMPESTVERQRERAGDAIGTLILAGRGGQPYTLGIALKDAAETRDGIMVTLTIMGDFGARDVSFLCPLWGLHQASNIMLAVAAALELGFPVATIQAALKSCPQVRHRQEVTFADVGPSVIDDAYNSNPTGFASALDTLNVLGVPGGRRVLITPGMVELGAAHDEKHLELGRKAGRSVDLALIAGAERIPTFIEGFRETAPEQAEIKTFARQQEAEDWYKANARDLDVVLFENNLPDLYEAKVRF